MNELTLEDAISIIGSKEVAIFQLRGQLLKANEIVKLLQAKITELDQKPKDQASDANSVPDAV